MTDYLAYIQSHKRYLKFDRHEHRIIFISKYLKYRQIPKGFLLPFHNNINFNFHQSLLKKCSRKLMVKTIGHYKSELKYSNQQLVNIKNLITIEYPERLDELLKQRQKKELNLYSIMYILSKRRRKKYLRDGLYKFIKSVEVIKPILKI